MQDDYLLSLIKNAPELLKLIYKDLAQPGVRKVGQALSTVLELANTILLPIKLLNEKSRLNFKNNMEKYKRNLEPIPDDKICDVPPEIGIPILDKLTYVSDDEISTLFVNLLSAASSSDTNKLAHPSFINCINNLSPDEAKIIQYLSDKTSLPFIDIKAKREPESGYCTLSKLALIDAPMTLSYSSNIEVYLDNIAGLGILTCTPGEYLSDDASYEKLISDFNNNIKPIYQMKFEKDGYKTFDYDKGVYHFTEYGKLFKKACTKGH